MSNARNLANLLGTGTTVPTAKIADDAITNAKLSDSDSFTVGGLTVSGATTLQGVTTATSTTTGFGVTDSLLLNGTDVSGTDAGSALLLNQTAAAGTDDGDNILFEDETADGSAVINSGEGHAISGDATKGQILQIQSVVDNVDRTFSGNQQIVYGSQPAKTAGFQVFSKTVTPISSRSIFYVFVKMDQGEATNTDNGSQTAVWAGDDFIGYNGGAVFVYSGGWMSIPQTNPINIQAVYQGKHQAGVAIEFQVRAGSTGTGTGAVRLNNGGTLGTAVTTFTTTNGSTNPASSSMIIMDVL